MVARISPRPANHWLATCAADVRSDTLAHIIQVRHLWAASTAALRVVVEGEMRGIASVLVAGPTRHERRCGRADRLLERVECGFVVLHQLGMRRGAFDVVYDVLAEPHDEPQDERRRLRRYDRWQCLQLLLA